MAVLEPRAAKRELRRHPSRREMRQPAASVDRNHPFRSGPFGKEFLGSFLHCCCFEKLLLFICCGWIDDSLEFEAKITTFYKFVKNKQYVPHGMLGTNQSARSIVLILNQSNIIVITGHIFRPQKELHSRVLDAYLGIMVYGV
mmetsp:Transcript_1563/g.4097  ORF Transcript_1563/g.4097 Transcript_1563/m.4097 type:complete len:143 (-) Transcript_1563:520-948(-)